MKQTFLPKVSEAVRVNIRHRQWQHALLAMAAVVVFITVYMLILPAITMTGPTCGLEEHTHSDSCYELRLVCGLEEIPEGDTAHVHGPACYEQQQVLTCGQEEGSGHTHTDACMGCVCGQEEGAGHTHTDACYADVTVEELTCTQEESAGHTHDASCYTVEEELTCGMSEGEGGHEHDDGCCDPETGELTCGMSEGEGGHEHDEGCYTQTETLTCTQEESAGHTHDASCYTQTVERQLVCGQEETEGHVHTDACMGYTCGQEESAGHTHTEACYTTQDVLICGESEGHTHTDACYEQVLVCQIPEHTHTEECYASGEEAPVEEIPEEDVPLGEYACGKEEHAHTQDCYDAGGNLICALEEHAHDESCLAEELPEYICGKEEHAHTEDCYDAGGNLICALEEHTHDETCLPVEQEPGAFPEELPEGYGEYEYEDADTCLSVLAYAPEGAFEEDVELHAQVLDQDSDAYADAQANLEDAGALDENTGMAALDISFRNADGDEVEPDPAAGPVYVRLDARALIPDGVDESTVAVQHHAETTDGGLFGTGIFAGTEVEVETVADGGSETAGEVALAPSSRPLAVPLSLPAETEEAPEEEAAQEEAAAALDVEAKFAVDGFSTFTITWVRSGAEVTVHFVDNNGNEFQEQQVQDYADDNETASDGRWVTLSQYFNANAVDGYTYLAARLGVLDEQTNEYVAGNTDVKQLKYQNNQFYYRTEKSDENGWVWTADEYHVFLVFKRTDLETVSGTTPTGVTVNLFDYTTEINGNHKLWFITSGGDGYNKYTGQGKGVYQGIVSEQLDANGYPYIPAEGRWDSDDSLDYLFDPDKFFPGYGSGQIAEVTNAQGLFQRNEDGYYYYDSGENFAELEKDRRGQYTGDITLYSLPRGDAMSPPSFPQFLPFNTLDGSQLHSDTNGYGDDPDSKEIYYYYNLNENSNMHFGMTIDISFLMPRDGLVDGEDMIFRFEGDDDVWVFIDDRLVLDMGGIHDNYEGYINFNTGEVWVEDTTNGTSDIKHLNELFDKDTMQDLFDDWEYQNHTLKFFYLERGEGGSNCRIEFNLPTIPENSLVLAKELDTGDAQGATLDYLNNLDFTFRVLKAEAANRPGTTDDNDFFIGENESYIVHHADGSESRETVGANGIITIKAGEYAVFDGIMANREDYVVQELIPEEYAAQYSGVTINQGEQTTLTESVEIGGVEYQSYVTNSQSPEDEETNVAFSNEINRNAMSYLYIHKDVVGTQPDGNDTFYMKVTLGGEPLGSNVNYQIQGGASQTTGRLGLIEIKAGETAMLPVLSGMEYKVVETDERGNELQSDEEWEIAYEKDSGLTPQPNESIKVTVTNTFPTTDAALTIVKDIYGLNETQVVELVNGTYRKLNEETKDESGLRFDVDYFVSKENMNTSDSDNKGDWTFDVSDTLDEDGFQGETSTWFGDITGYEDGGPTQSIDSTQIDHYIDSSLKKIDELHYQYKITIDNLDLEDWYRVWELHMDVPGYTMTAEVSAVSGNQDITNQLTDKHDGRAIGFQLTDDTTVTFTNRYSQGQLDLTKNVTVSGQTDNTGTTEFEFEIRIPAKWAKPAEYNTGEYPVTYTRVDVEDTSENESEVIHTDTDGLLKFEIEENGNGDYAMATIRLYAGETAHIKLPTGIDVIVTEPNHDGYSVNWNVSGSDILNQESENSVRFTLSDEKAVTCTNTTGAVLPSTGGPGVANILTLGTLLTLGAGALLLLQRRRKEGDAC